MKMFSLAVKNTKEILRDPLNLAFGLGFPLVLMLLLSAIQANIPVEMFEIAHLTPGITVFGLSFISLFSATILSKDRQSSLLRRLYTTPLRASDFILSYTLPFIPISVVQCIACYVAAVILGLDITVNILFAVLLIIPISLLYIAIGLLCGSVLTDKQAGGICGALLTNVSAWLSGIWFDIELIGGAFGKIANALPFIHAVELERAALAGNFDGIIPHLLWVLTYTLVLGTLAVVMFLRQMKRQ
ncbi:MAG: ABC transporter permease [Clostridia bacterium]|nr:ABC transporter permease [Clostridia bacterium]